LTLAAAGSVPEITGLLAVTCGYPFERVSNGGKSLGSPGSVYSMIYIHLYYVLPPAFLSTAIRTTSPAMVYRTTN
jgi:hypothetical protein